MIRGFDIVDTRKGKKEKILVGFFSSCLYCSSIVKLFFAICSFRFIVYLESLFSSFRKLLKIERNWSMSSRFDANVNSIEDSWKVFNVDWKVSKIIDSRIFRKLWINDSIKSYWFTEKTDSLIQIYWDWSQFEKLSIHESFELGYGSDTEKKKKNSPSKISNAHSTISILSNNVIRNSSINSIAKERIARSVESVLC